MSNFYNHKLKTYFAATDADKDGVLTENDYHVMAKRFIDIVKLDAPHAAKIHQLATKVPYLSIVHFHAARFRCVSTVPPSELSDMMSTPTGHRTLLMERSDSKRED